MNGGRDGFLRLPERLAWAAIAWERLWPALWPATGIAGLFVFLSLVGLWAHLPGWLHLAGLVLFAIGFVAVLVRGLRGLRAPDRLDAVRRLERDSGVPHRPLATIEDQLADSSADETTRAIWYEHQRRARERLGRLRPGLPHPELARHDPRALRGALILLLVIGVGVAGQDAPERLRHALLPDLSVARAPIEIEAWISPPPYTRLPPVFLTRNATAPGGPGPVVETAVAAPDPVHAVPVGSTLLIRLNGGKQPPELVIDGQAQAFEAIDASNYQIESTLSTAEQIVVREGENALESWQVRIIPDLPPTIAFDEPPMPTARSALGLRYSAADDYGLADAVVELTRPVAGPSGTAGDVTGEHLEIALVLPALSPRQATGQSFHDLTAHPWAGTRVDLRLLARDHAGQQGASETVSMVLPERVFFHPVARAIVEQRKLLTLEPEKRERIARALSAISAVPERYHEDVVAFLALRIAVHRLLSPEGAAAIPEVQEILWETALRIEDGNVSLAERALRSAQERLQEALARNAPDDEIERLIDELRQAMEEFMQALAEQAQRQMAEGGELPEIDADAQTLNQQDLQEMLDRIGDLSKSGAKEMAQNLLNQLRQMLENLQAGRMPNMGQQQAGQQALQELGNLMQGQQELLDETFRRSQQGQRGQQGQQGQRRPGQPGEQGQPGQPGDSGDLAARQEALRRALGDIMARLGAGRGAIPDPLGQAERMMRDAGRSLEGSETESALGSQSDALEQLRAGAQALAQEMMEQMGQGEQGRTAQNPGDPSSRDPLGRPVGGNWGDTGDDVSVPDKADLQRAREILNELYRRSGERGRPRFELDYIDRLLRRF
ncbi:TIGR02302 family protein [Oceanibacterium hippocampi]|uniref:TIGR02302 family protein n=1 Tax=Oceanibacterium hippocampi TaxID=745714 RepID=A0A1Y5RX83_9PROT|nr:TIGR02302 family protein [Oceanibacterium hippocampi]SLN26537.1 hypothetical protein OCH7691_00825 [Oceanibacterium hippocampi]